MNSIAYPLAQGRFINRFLQTPIEEKQERFAKTVMGGKVNEWLKYGFSINDNPCRKEFIALKKASEPTYVSLGGAAAGQSITLGERTFEMGLYVPFGNVSVDHSSFWHIPTSLVSYYVTGLYSEREWEAHPFELSTCGGATLWVNGQRVESFRPFTRNVVKKTRFSCALREGVNEIAVCLEDLAERDTDYYFRLESLSPDGLEIRLPLREDVDGQRLMQVETVLENALIHLDEKLEGWLDVEAPNTTTQPLTLSVRTLSGFDTQVDDPPQTFTLMPGQSHMRFLIHPDLAPAFYPVSLRVEVGPIKLTRLLGSQMTRRALVDLPRDDLATRKHKLLKYAALHSPMNAYRAVALFALGEDAALANRILQSELPGIRQHRDCSDFYLIAHLYALMRYRDRLEKQTAEQLEDAIITFRYWIDEPGNDVMWFFSENHALLFHSCQYIAGKMFPDRVFTASGLTGRACEEKARALLESWFDDFEREYMTEWNSNAYLPVDCTGFGFMLLMTDPQDPLHARFQKALDRIYLNLCLYALRDTYVSSYGRSYEKQLKANLTNATSTLLYLGYGVGCLSASLGSVVPLALSGYQPPLAYERYLALPPGEALWYTNEQGYEHHVALTLWRTCRASLSTANAFKPYRKGYQEHIVQASIDAFAQCFVNHPGETHAFGSGRPSHWAGNGSLPLAMQWKDTAIMRYHIPQDALVHDTHAYFPFEAFQRVAHGADWYAGEKEGGYLFVWAQNGLRRRESGPAALEELVSEGLENCWVLRVSDASAYDTLEAFAADCQPRVLACNAQSVTLAMQAWGEITLVDHPPALQINGHPVKADFSTSEGQICLECLSRRNI